MKKCQLSTLTCQLITHNSPPITNKGFTLVELLVVFAIFFIASTAGMVSFQRYTTSQILNQSSTDLISLLNTLRTNAVTQNTLGTCTQQLLRYSIRIIPPATHEQWAYCNGTSFRLNSQKLSAGVIFDTGTSNEISFLIPGGLSSGGTINLKGANATQTIQIDTSGNITSL